MGGTRDSRACRFLHRNGTAVVPESAAGGGMAGFSLDLGPGQSIIPLPSERGQE